MKKDVVGPRVLHVVTRLGLGGAEAVAVSIAEGLNHEIPGAIFAVRGVRRSAVGAKLEKRLRNACLPLFTGPEWPLKAGGMIPAAFALKRAIRRFEPDVIHLHTEIPEAALAMLAALAPAAARHGVVRTIHHSAFWTFWPRLGGWCEKRIPDGAIAGVSFDALEGFREHRRRSGQAQPMRSSVIYNGIEPPAVVQLSERRVRRPAKILYAGRLDWEKGADLLPEIIRRTRIPVGGAELTVHGEGRQENLLRKRLRRTIPGWKTTMLPPTDQLEAVFANHDLLIMPSRIEGLGLVAIEASLHGLPVVATRAKGLREAFPPDHPWLPDAGDPEAFAHALSDALAEPKLRTAATIKAHHLARQRFNPRVMLASYARLHRAAAWPEREAGS